MLTIVIQAGGASRRMGEDKALKRFMGRPLIQRVIDRFSSSADEMIINANNRERYRIFDRPVIADLIPDRGALGGLYTALYYASHPYAAVIACDMPFANAPLIKAQLDLLIRENADVVIPKTDEGFEPFHAVYKRETCLAAIKSAIDHDQWKMISWFPHVIVRSLTSAEIALHDPRGLAFHNLNTPAEFAEAEALARSIDNM
jgi:molybdopterin-guanine dinucleotide biosynthesis protein A